MGMEKQKLLECLIIGSDDFVCNVLVRLKGWVHHG